MLNRRGCTLGKKELQARLAHRSQRWRQRGGFTPPCFHPMTRKLPGKAVYIPARPYASVQNSVNLNVLSSFLSLLIGKRRQQTAEAKLKTKARLEINRG